MFTFATKTMTFTKIDSNHDGVWTFRVERGVTIRVERKDVRRRRAPGWVKPSTKRKAAHRERIARTSSTPRPEAKPTLNPLGLLRKAQQNQPAVPIPMETHAPGSGTDEWRDSD